MTAARVVPASDEVEDGQARVGVSREAGPIEQLALEGREDALAEGVVVGVADATHRRPDAGVATPPAESEGRPTPLPSSPRSMRPPATGSAGSTRTIPFRTRSPSWMRCANGSPWPSSACKPTTAMSSAPISPGIPVTSGSRTAISPLAAPRSMARSNAPHRWRRILSPHDIPDTRGARREAPKLGTRIQSPPSPPRSRRQDLRRARLRTQNHRAHCAGIEGTDHDG
jgi:hypothetical protein